MKKYQQINRQRANRAFRVSNAVKRVSDRLRLAVFRSNSHIYVQIIDDNVGRTLVSASTRDKDLRTSIKTGGNAVAAGQVGTAIGKKAVAAGIVKVAFDRHGFKYHGRIKALADAARNAGLDIGAIGEVKAKPEATVKKAKTVKQAKKS